MKFRRGIVVSRCRASGKLLETWSATLPDLIRAILICLGAIFFLAHFASAIYSVRCFKNRNEKLEAAGKVVPGLAGLLFVAAGLLWPSGWAPVCLALSLPVLIVGRAIYELIVFPNRGGRPPAE